MGVVVFLLLTTIALLGFLLWRERKKRSGTDVDKAVSAATTRYQQQLGGREREVRDLERKLAAQQGQHTLELQERESQYVQALAASRHSFELEYEQRKRTDRAQSNERSRSALVAKVAEHFTPVLNDFVYNFKDARHIGELFDFLVFDGLEEGHIRNVIFLEVKTGTSYQARQLNPREKLLRDAIDNGRVKYEVYVPQLPAAR